MSESAVASSLKQSVRAGWLAGWLTGWSAGRRCRPTETSKQVFATVLKEKTFVVVK